MNKMRILMASPDPKRLSAFTDGLAQMKNVAVTFAQTGKEAVTRVGDLPPEDRPHLVIFDETLADGPCVNLVAALMQVDAMISTALVSDMPQARFHAQTEGLGILGRIPSSAGPREAGDLAEKLGALLWPDTAAEKKREP